MRDNSRKMTEKAKQQEIIAIVDKQSDAIEALDNDMMMETVGVSMALDELRKSINLIEAHLNEREFEKASQAGYHELANSFIYVQRTLAGIQTNVHRKESLISGIALMVKTAYEDVAPFVEKKMQSSVKRPVNPAQES
jgi:predicted O-linked N-acetylglucosamine transferase (SPINDLY family)